MNRRMRRAIKKHEKKEGRMTMGKAHKGDPDAIEKLRAMIDPDAYIAQFKEAKTRFLTQAATYIQELDLTDAAESTKDSDKAMLRERLEGVLAEIYERVALIDERVEEFAKDREKATKPFAQKVAKRKVKEAKEEEEEVVQEEEE